MAHSSLNWENETSWHDRLLGQCLKDCGNWRKGMRGRLAGDPKGTTRRCAVKYCGGLAGDFLEDGHPFAASIDDEFECRAGCSFFAQCKHDQPEGSASSELERQLGHRPEDNYTLWRQAIAVGAAVLNAQHAD